MNQKLKYEKFNNCKNVISIDLHNGYTVIAISGFNTEKNIYTATLFLKDNTVDDWKLIEKAELLEFAANENTINSAILKQVSTFLEEGLLEYYIIRYEYEMDCFNRGNEIKEQERINNNE